MLPIQIVFQKTHTLNAMCSSDPCSIWKWLEHKHFIIGSYDWKLKTVSPDLLCGTDNQVVFQGLNLQWIFNLGNKWKWLYILGQKRNHTVITFNLPVKCSSTSRDFQNCWKIQESKSKSIGIRSGRDVLDWSSLSPPRWCLICSARSRLGVLKGWAPPLPSR